jgi:Zn-dependent protease with chaperone function
MFPKFAKKIHFGIVLLSYAATSISMEQPNPSWWQRVKNWMNSNNSSAVKTLSYGIGVPLFAGLSNYIALRNAYHHYKINNNINNLKLDILPLINVNTFDKFPVYVSQFPQEKLSLIKDTLLKMGISPTTIVFIDSSLEGEEHSTAFTISKLIGIKPSAMNSLPLDELSGIIAHEGSHVINNDGSNRMLFGLAASTISFCGLVGGYYGLKKVIRQLKRNYPKWTTTLNRAQTASKYILLNPLLNNLIASYITSRYGRLQELRADADSARSVGAAGLIKFLKNSQLEEELRIQELDMKDKVVFNCILALQKAFDEHPSGDVRIKALEAIQQ